VRCGTCSEEYQLGQKISRPGGFHFFPEGEQAFHRHVSDSPRHQAICDINGLAMANLLVQLPDALKRGRAHQKRMADPVVASLRELFR